MSESIKAKFLVTRTAVVVSASYHDVAATIRWKRTEDSVRHVKTLIANLPEVVKEGIEEAFIKDQMNRLDFDIESLFLEAEEDRPDDS